MAKSKIIIEIKQVCGFVLNNIFEKTRVTIKDDFFPF